MPVNKALTTLPNDLKNVYGVSYYVHSINTMEDAKKFFSNGIEEPYTDFLPPHKVKYNIIDRIK